MPTRLTRARQVIPSNAEVKYFTFTGGLNIVDAAFTIQPGECLAAANFECDTRGRYRRVDGYERFDGQTLPSEAAGTVYRMRVSGASITKSPFSSGFSDGFSWRTIVENAVLHGGTSGAVGKVISITVESGSLGSSALVSIYFTNISGTFVSGESIYFLRANSATSAGFNTGFK